MARGGMQRVHRANCRAKMPDLKTAAEGGTDVGGYDEYHPRSSVESTVCFMQDHDHCNAKAGMKRMSDLTARQRPCHVCEPYFLHPKRKAVAQRCERLGTDVDEVIRCCPSLYEATDLTVESTKTVRLSPAQSEHLRASNCCLAPLSCLHSAICALLHRSRPVWFSLQEQAR